MKNDTGIWGQATIRLLGPEGDLKFYEVKKNLITTNGDKYYAQMGCAGVGGETGPATAKGMKLGKNATGPAVAKSGSGAATVSGDYLTGSNQLFVDANTGTSAVGSDTGWKITYQCSWGAGVATHATITEAVIFTDTNANAVSTEANTISRVIFSAINKGASDTLVINWDHTFYDNPTP